MRQPGVLLALLLGVLIHSACSGLAGEPQQLATLTPPPPRAQADLANGARIFAERCSTCHGLGGAGDGELALNGSIPPPGDFTQPWAARNQTPLQWLGTIRDGRIEALMPPWRDALTEGELRDVTLYSYTLHYLTSQIARGQQVLDDACASGCAALEALGDLRDPATLDRLSDADLRDALPASLPADDAWAAVAWLRARDLRGLESGGQPWTTPAPTSAVIRGQIRNGSQGFGVPTGLKVTLLEFGTGTMPELRETRSAADGSFRFEDLTLASGRSYSVLVEHAGRRFPSARVAADPARAQIDLPVTIFETGAHSSAIEMTALAQQVSVEEDALQVVVVARFRNDSDRVYSSENEVAPGQYASLVLPLPAGVSDLTLPADSGRFLVDLTAGTVTDTLPVYPGIDHMLQLAWRQPRGQDRHPLEFPLNYALAGEVRLLLGPGLALADEGFTSIGPQQVGASFFDGHRAQLRLEPGERLRYTLLEQTPTLPPGVVGVEALAPGALLTVALVIVLLRWRHGGVGERRRVDDLARQIARLDEEHERGAINHDVYRRRRAALQAHLTGENDGSDEGAN
ncbi:MAG: c-type cytochrome [Anaerolineaceae bacterium]|nr:c-type cytochrome [Anaerolineaceae bacterium]